MQSFARITRCRGIASINSLPKWSSYLHSHFVSAKTDDLINALFLRVSAEALGIKISYRDLEQTSTVIKAEIVQYKNTPAAEPKRTRSSFCIIQWLYAVSGNPITLFFCNMSCYFADHTPADFAKLLHMRTGQNRNTSCALETSEK